MMDNIRCFNCQNSIYRDKKGFVHHKKACELRKISTENDNLFRKRSCRFFELRSERRVKIKVLTKEEIHA